MTEDNTPSYQDGLYQLADELRAIASNGLRHAKSSYDIERFENVLKASTRLISIIENRPADEVAARYRDNLDHICPLLGVEAFVLRDERLLLIKRHDDGLWALPGGQVEVGETLREAALRELKEETGLSGSVIRLLGIFDSTAWGSRLKSQAYHVIFRVAAEEGFPVVTNESTDCGYFSREELPELSPGHHRRIPFLFGLTDGTGELPYFD